ncbi:MAG: acyl carrier protein [Bacteroidota bacterium]
MEKLLQIINNILLNKEKQPIHKLIADDSLTNTLGLDSLDLAELTVRIEAEFDIDVFEDGLVLTVGEIIKKLNLNE